MKLLRFEYIIILNVLEKGVWDLFDKFWEYFKVEGICIGVLYEFVIDGIME